jgi:hypothetical protein
MFRSIPVPEPRNYNQMNLIPVPVISFTHIFTVTRSRFVPVPIKQMHESCSSEPKNKTTNLDSENYRMFLEKDPHRSLNQPTYRFGSVKGKIGSTRRHQENIEINNISQVPGTGR